MPFPGIFKFLLSFLGRFIPRKALKEVCVLISPQTLINWQNNLFKFLWSIISRPRRIPHNLTRKQIVNLIQNIYLSTGKGAESIFGIMKNLGVHVCKRTIQKYIALISPFDFVKTVSRSWQTFIENHRDYLFAVDFAVVHNIFTLFRPLYIILFISLKTRRIVHFNVTANPKEEWVRQQMREAAPFLDSKFYLIHDNDSSLRHIPYKLFGITPKRTSVKAPNMNAYIERFIRTLRQDCLNHFIITGEKHLRAVLKEYIQYYNTLRPHQGIGQQIPCNVPARPPNPEPLNIFNNGIGAIRKRPILNGLHYHYYRDAA